MSESEACIWLAFAIRFGALSTDWPLLITLELPLAASEAISSVRIMASSRGGQMNQPVRDLMP